MSGSPRGREAFEGSERRGLRERQFECYGDEYWHVCNRALGAAKESAAQDGLRLVSETEDYFNTPASQEGEQAHA